MLISVKRQDIVFIFQKDRAFLRGKTRKLVVAVRHIRSCGSCRTKRLRRPEHDAQHALCRAVNVLLREPPILHGRKTLIFHIGAASRHIEVAARLKALDPVVHRTPVRHDHAVKAPVLP